MLVLVHCDDQVCRDVELIRRVEGVMGGTLERLSSRVARVEVHLRDLNSSKSGDRDKICTLEARITGAGSVRASHEAATLAEAIHDAAGQLERLIARE